MKILVSIALCWLACQTIIAQTIVENSWLIQLKSTTNYEQFVHTLPNNAQLKTVSTSWNLYELQAANIQDFLAQSPHIQVFQTNHILKSRTTPNDPYYTNHRLWNLDLINATDAWDFTTGGVTANGDTIVAAIIDEGCDQLHPDLQTNIWKNKLEIPDNQVDDDANGYVDDVRGWSVARQNDSMDITTHGTSVSSIVGAIGNNHIGVTGINWNIKLMQLQADVNGVITESNVVAAYHYIASMRRLYHQTQGQKGAYIVVTNASFGIDRAKASDFPIWCAVYDSLGALGIMNVAATANNAQDIDIVGDMPTSCPSPFLIMVTESTENDLLHTSAAYGAVSVDIAAPGTVYAARPNNTYNSFGGTSGAAPHLTGSVALLCAYSNSIWAAELQNNPASAMMTLKNILLQTAAHKAVFEGKMQSEGRLDIGAAMKRLHETFTPPIQTDILNIMGGYHQLQAKITLAASQNYSLLIYNVLSQKIWEANFYNSFPTTSYQTLPMELLHPGGYILMLRIGNKTWSKPFSIH